MQSLELQYLVSLPEFDADDAVAIADLGMSKQEMAERHFWDSVIAEVEQKK